MVHPPFLFSSQDFSLEDAACNDVFLQREIVPPTISETKLIAATIGTNSDKGKSNYASTLLFRKKGVHRPNPALQWPGRPEAVSQLRWNPISEHCGR
jgi:hypothetical protein